MSQNHKRSGWATVSARHRPSIRAALPSPCVNPPCKHGGMVYPGQRFDVAHIVDADAGGSNDRSNLGAAHPDCNRRDGGRIGARKTNEARRSQKRRRAW